jgi:hypothetical protein
MGFCGAADNLLRYEKDGEEKHLWGQSLLDFCFLEFDSRKVCFIS